MARAHQPCPITNSSRFASSAFNFNHTSKKPKIFTYKRLSQREAQESKVAMYFYFTSVGMVLCVVAVICGSNPAVNECTEQPRILTRFHGQ